MGSQFWGVTDQIPEPKRQFKWILRSKLGPTWVVKSAKKPSFTKSITQVKYINHTFKYPGRVEWQDLDITFVDAVLPDTAAAMMINLGWSGYEYPLTEQAASFAQTKANAVRATGGSVYLQQIGESQSDVLEEWTLKNAWVGDVDFGELTYEDEGLVEVKIKMVYDWAVLSIKGEAWEGITNAAKNAKYDIEKIVGKKK